MLQNFISVITSLGVTLQEFCYITLIFYFWLKPVKWLIGKFFKGVN